MCYNAHCIYIINKGLFKSGVHQPQTGTYVPDFLKLFQSRRLYVCVCPPSWLLITSGVIWCDMDYIWLIKQGLRLLYGNGYVATETLSYVTGFWKTNQNVILGLFHYTVPANSHTHTCTTSSCLLCNHHCESIRM